MITLLTNRGIFEVHCEPESTPASVLGGVRSRFPSMPDRATVTLGGRRLELHAPLGQQGVRSGDTVVVRWS